MKKKLVTVLLLAGLCASVNMVMAKPDSDSSKPREVYVNLDMVWRSSPQGKKDMEEIDAIVKETREKVKNLREELKTLGEGFKAAKTKEEKEAKAKEIEQKRRELIELTTTKNKEIEAKKNKAQQEFVDAVIPLINKFRKDNGYLIIHRFTPNDIISIDPEVDVTDEILEIYSNNSNKN